MVGPILVFLVLIGVISSSFVSYQTAEQKAVLIRYQRRAGFAFAGFVLALRAGSGNLNNLDKWKFCLNAA